MEKREKTERDYTSQSDTWEVAVSGTETVSSVPTEKSNLRKSSSLVEYGAAHPHKYPIPILHLSYASWWGIGYRIKNNSYSCAWILITNPQVERVQNMQLTCFLNPLSLLSWWKEWKFLRDPRTKDWSATDVVLQWHRCCVGDLQPYLEQRANDFRIFQSRKQIIVQKIRKDLKTHLINI